MFRVVASWMMLLAACLATGCESKPRAPALLDEPVYKNDQEGFRFLVPEGWTKHAQADLPPGKLARERMLVMYRLMTDKGATLQVAANDFPAGADLGTYLSGPSFGVKQWMSTAEPKSVPVGGKSGEQFSHSSLAGGSELMKEVVAIRRGERVYFFNGIYWKSDTAARDQIRRAIDSIIWRD